MRTVTDLPELLEVRSDPSAQRVLCGVMAVVGCALIAMQLPSDAEASLLAYLIGALMLGVGSAGIALLRMTWLRVDVRYGAVIIGSSSLWSVHERRFATADIHQVVLEESVDSDGDSSFRVVLVLPEGRRAPLTEAYSPDFERTSSIASAARRRILPHAPDSPPPRGRVVSRRSLHLEQALTIGMLLFATVFVGAGVHLASREQQLLRSFAPTNATVLDVSVDTRRADDGGVVRRPAVRYAYVVAGTTHVSDRVLPLDEWREGGWAREIAERFTPGQRVRAFYDPADPAQAYLLRRRSALPLLFISIPLFGALLLSYGGLTHLRR